MNDLVKISFKRSIIVPEIQNRLKFMDENRYIYEKLIYSRNEIDSDEDIPLYVKDYIKKNYTDKIAILHWETLLSYLQSNQSQN